MHTPVEVLSLSDLEKAVRLITATLYRIGAKEVFIPG
jgi:putative aminopeptidase FrvX